MLETVQRIEPARLEQAPEAIADLIADLSAAAATLGRALHPRTAASLRDLVGIMNTYYSNLIEGHNTRPRDIELALAGHFDANEAARNLQLEAAAHVRVQAELDRRAANGDLPEPASVDFIRDLHREFYRDAPEAMLTVRGTGKNFLMVPGEWRSGVEQDVAVGRHVPPSSDRIPDFMAYFAERYRLANMGKATRITAIAASHHRFNFIHPFPDGNGRVSRLMSHAFAHAAGIGAQGLWSLSRGLARGLESRTEYKTMMDHADMSRQGDYDGRGNLSEKALITFVTWFLKVCLDQVSFMSGLFELDRLAARLNVYVERSDILKPQATQLLQQTLVRGEIDRGDVSAITGLPERSARRVLAGVLETGLLSSDSPKGKLYLRFPADTVELLFPRLFPES
ncbi:MAG TPA: Fic family protein [Devosia sp.]